MTDLVTIFIVMFATQLVTYRIRGMISWNVTIVGLGVLAVWAWLAQRFGAEFPWFVYVSPFFGIAAVLLYGWIVRRRWRAEASVDPLLLAAPFDGVWRVSEIGLDLASSEYMYGQRFSYEFVRKDGDTFGSAIYAPVSGQVVMARGDIEDGPDPDPRYADWPKLGNIIAIATDRGVVVLLGHLRLGSLRVSVGERVAVGDRIAECGRSGGTKVALHVHVQRDLVDAPLQNPGIPIAFWDGKQRHTLSYRDRLTRGDSARAFATTAVA